MSCLKESFTNSGSSWVLSLAIKAMKHKDGARESDVSLEVSVWSYYLILVQIVVSLSMNSILHTFFYVWLTVELFVCGISVEIKFS